MCLIHTYTHIQTHTHTSYIRMYMHVHMYISLVRKQKTFHDMQCIERRTAFRSKNKTVLVVFTPNILHRLVE